MNELIRELEKQSYVDVDAGDGVYQKFSTQKFAELIIHECAIAMSKIPGGYSAEKYYESNKIIKQHFGVNL